MTIRPVFPLETTDCDASTSWRQQNLFSQGSQPFTSPPSWCGASLLVAYPNLVFPTFVFLESRLPPWSNFQILDSPTSLEGDMIMWSSCSQGEVCWRIRGNILRPSVKSTWLESCAFLHVAGPLVWGGCVPRCHSRSCNPREWLGGQPRVWSPELLELQGLQALGWVRPISPSSLIHTQGLSSDLSRKRDPAASFFKTFMKYCLH